MVADIELIPAPHEADYSERVSGYLLEVNCNCLCLEFPSEVEKYIREFAKGERAYSRLKKVLIDGDILSPIFESGYRPLFAVLPKLNDRVSGFEVCCYEDLGTFNDWVMKKDEFVVQLLTSKEQSTLKRSFEELVEETNKRNMKIVDRLSEIASGTNERIHVVIGRLHAPLIREEFSDRFSVDETILVDVSVTPLDEAIILGSRGELEDLWDYLDRHTELARKAGETGTKVMDILRSDEVIEEYSLTPYSRL